MGKAAHHSDLPTERQATQASSSLEMVPETTFSSGFLEDTRTSSSIQRAVYAEFKPETPWEDVKVDEIARLTIRLRDLERERDLVLRAHAHEAVHQQFLELQRLGRLDGVTDDLRRLAQDWAFGANTAHSRAARRLTEIGVSLDRARARAVTACVDALATIDKSSHRIRRQRDAAEDDLRMQRQARERAEVPDAEVLE